MDTINFLAYFWGFSMIIMGFACLINYRNREHILEIYKDDKMLMLFGFFSVFLGVTLLLMYHTWDKSWTVILTILGWATTIKGAVLLAYPDIIKNHLKKTKYSEVWFPRIMVGTVVIGCILVYLGSVS
jgi:cytochrome bd-type quinol oxidase subunit 2